MFAKLDPDNKWKNNKKNKKEKPVLIYKEQIYHYIFKDCLEYYFLVKKYGLTKQGEIIRKNVYHDYLFFFGLKEQKNISVYNQEIYNTNILRALNMNMNKSFLLPSNIIGLFKLLTLHFSILSDVKNMGNFIDLFIKKRRF